jgi:hypothetical protein
MPITSRRTAAFQLVRLHGLTDGGAISTVQLLACLDLVVRFVVAPANHLHLIEAITTDLSTTTADVSDRQRLHLLVYRAILLGKLSEIEDEQSDIRLQAASSDYASAWTLYEEIMQTRGIQLADHWVDARIKLGAANLLVREFEELPASARSKEKKRLLREAVKLYSAAAKAARAYGQDVILEAIIYKELSYTYACLARWLDAEKQYRLALDTLERAAEHIADSQAYMRQRVSVLETAIDMHLTKGRASSAGPDSSQALQEYIVGYDLVQQEIALLQQGSHDNLRLIVAYFNAGDYLLAMSKCANCPVSEASREAIARLQTAYDTAHRLGLKYWEDKTRRLIDEHSRGKNRT